MDVKTILVTIAVVGATIAAVDKFLLHECIDVKDRVDILADLPLEPRKSGDELDRFAPTLDGLQGLQCSLTNPRFGTSRRPFQMSNSFREPGL